MTSYIVRARVREATLNDTDAFGHAPFGQFEPSVGVEPIFFRVKLREAGRR